METIEVRQNVVDIIADVALDEDLSEIKDDVALRDQLDLDYSQFPRLSSFRFVLHQGQRTSRNRKFY